MRIVFEREKKKDRKQTIICHKSYDISSPSSYYASLADSPASIFPILSGLIAGIQGNAHPSGFPNLLKHISLLPPSSARVLGPLSAFPLFAVSHFAHARSSDNFINSGEVVGTRGGCISFTASAARMTYSGLFSSSRGRYQFHIRRSVKARSAKRTA